jgi:hypothetical protein
MRLCPQVQDAMDPTTSTKFDRVRIRQAAFLANVQKTNTRDVRGVDYPDPLLFLHTIRSMVMDIRSNQDPEKKVFISKAVSRQRSMFPVYEHVCQRGRSMDQRVIAIFKDTIPRRFARTVREMLLSGSSFTFGSLCFGPN